MAKVVVKFDRERLRAALKETEASTFNAVGEVALSLLESLIAAKKMGSELLIRDKAGKEEIITPWNL